MIDYRIAIKMVQKDWWSDQPKPAHALRHPELLTRNCIVPIWDTGTGVWISSGKTAWLLEGISREEVRASMLTNAEPYGITKEYQTDIAAIAERSLENADPIEATSLRIHKRSETTGEMIDLAVFVDIERRLLQTTLAYLLAPLHGFDPDADLKRPTEEPGWTWKSKGEGHPMVGHEDGTPKCVLMPMGKFDKRYDSLIDAWSRVTVYRHG